MLSKDDRRRLQDILDMSAEIADFVHDVDAETFALDLKARRAVERCMTIIGEAAKNVRPEVRAQIDQPWRAIIRFRDLGIHAYDTLTPSRIHRTAAEDVPALAQAIVAYLAQHA